VALTEEQQRNDAARRQARDVVTERDTLAQLGERLAEALCGLVNRADRAATDHPWEWKDHACAECGGTMVREGFRCARHAAHDVLSAWTKARGKGE
jgi:hypothetical protein